MRTLVVFILFSSMINAQIAGVDQFVIMSEPNLIDTAMILDSGVQFWNNYEELTGKTIEETKDIGKVTKYFKNIDSLPDYGQLCKKNTFYKYGSNDTVFCRQEHYRTIYTPYETPALFSFARYDNGSLEWIENEYVYADSTRFYNDVAYLCLQEHLTLSNWTPDVTPTLWKVKTTGCPEWIQPSGASDAYNIGDCVTFNGGTYESLINANVWSPLTYPAGWSLIE